MSLTQIKSEPSARTFATYDLEWIPETYELRLGGFFDGAHYRSFPTVEGLLNHMLRPVFKKTWFYAHAGGLADMHFLLQKLQEKRDIRLSATFSGSSAIIVKVTWRGNVYTFLDSYWLLRDKLAHLAPYTGIDKGRGDFKCSDYPACGHIGRTCDSAPSCGCSTEPEPLCMFRAPYAILRDYNERDCRILYRAIELFQETLLDIGTELRSTIASTALGLFRTKYLRQKIRTDEALNDWHRASYIASRVEVIRPVLDADAFYYDINSSFPFAMTQPCPGEYLGQSSNIPEDDSTLYFADATVHVPDMFLPPLGARGRDGRIYFPSGSWRGQFAKPDIELLLESGGRVETVHEVALYHPFNDLCMYALDLYDRRLRAKKSGQTFLALVLKYLLNSCYGKFGEHRQKEQLLMHPSSERCPHGGKHDRVVGGFGATDCVEVLFPGVILVSEEKKVAHEHVPIASHITATARATLYRFLRLCGEDLYYTDTDSIVTGQILPTGPELGALKLEHEVKKGRFIQPKLYEIDGHVKSKGFSRLTGAQFDDLVRGEEIKVDRMYRVKETARELRSFGPHGKTFGKRIRLGASRPKRRPVGDRTVPWTHDEIMEPWKKT